MEFDKPRRAFRIEKELQRMPRRGFCGSERIKNRARMNPEMFAAALVLRRTRRNHFQQSLGQRQYVRLDRGEHSRKRAPLLRGRDYLCWRLSVTAQCKRVVHAAYELACGLHLIAMK